MRPFQILEGQKLLSKKHCIPLTRVNTRILTTLHPLTHVNTLILATIYPLTHVSTCILTTLYLFTHVNAHILATLYPLTHLNTRNLSTIHPRVTAQRNKGSSPSYFSVKNKNYPHPVKKYLHLTALLSNTLTHQFKKMQKLYILLFSLIIPVIAFSQGTIVSVTPNSGAAGQTLTVTITGSGTSFNTQSGTIVDFSFNTGSGTVVNSAFSTSSTSLDVNFTIPANTPIGDYDVSVGYFGGSSYIYSMGGFHVVAASSLPTLVAVSPNNASQGQTLNVTITGSNTHFASGSPTVSFSFSQGSFTTLTVNSINITDDSSLTANITVPVNAPIADYLVQVSGTADGILQLFNGFYVNSDTTPPPTNTPFLLDVISVDASSSANCDGSFDFVAHDANGNMVSTATTSLFISETGATLNLNNTNQGVGLCPGVYAIIATDSAGDTAFTSIVIGYPGVTFTDTLNVFPDSTFWGTVTNTAQEDCNINYGAIDSINISGYVVVATDSVLVTWNIYSGGAATSVYNTYIVGANGTYTFVLQLYCDSTRALEYLKAYGKLYINTTTVGISQSVEQTQTTIFPVPVSNMLNVQLSNDRVNTLSIYNAVGQEVLKTKLSGSTIHTINMEGIVSGYYFVKIDSGSGVEYMKIVKE